MISFVRTRRYAKVIRFALENVPEHDGGAQTSKLLNLKYAPNVLQVCLII